MTRAIIVDDEERSADVLKELLSKSRPSIEIIAQPQSVKSAIEAIRELKPDLVFLDVELPDGSGFKVLEAFPEEQLNVIFVTAFEHYAIKAIRACALDYLLKPVDIDDLLAAVDKVKSEEAIPEFQSRKEMFLQNNQSSDIYRRKIALPTTQGLVFAAQNNIVYCEADDSYTYIYLVNKEKILVCKPLSYFEEMLNEESFCRCHQSYLVNLDHAKEYVKGRGGQLIMDTGAIVEVSIRLKSNLLERFGK